MNNSAIQSALVLDENVGALTKLEKWFPLQGERGHSSYCRSFKKQNREEGETE